MFFVVLCPGTPKGSTGSGSGFKTSQKTGQRLKVSSDRLGEAGNRTCDTLNCFSLAADDGYIVVVHVFGSSLLSSNRRKKIKINGQSLTPSDKNSGSAHVPKLYTIK